MFFIKTFASSLLLSSVSAKYLVSYNASAGDAASGLGQLNLDGWDREDWPPGKGENSSCFFKTSTDPAGVPAAHVHKDAHFVRAEYHMLKDKIEEDQTYYIGYKVRFDAVDYQTFVWQWKNYDKGTVDADNVPIVLTFRKDVDDDDYHRIVLQANPSAKKGGATVVWSKALTMGKTYTFGLVINTSTSSGYLQMYFNGSMVTMTDASGTKTKKLSGNFFPGAGKVSPKVGLYGDDAGTCDSYIYNVIVGTTLANIKDIPGMIDE